MDQYDRQMVKCKWGLKRILTLCTVREVCEKRGFGKLVFTFNYISMQILPGETG